MHSFRKLVSLAYFAFPLGIIALHHAQVSPWWGAGLGAIGIALHLRQQAAANLKPQILALVAIVIALANLQPDHLVRVYPFLVAFSFFTLFFLGRNEERPILVRFASMVRPVDAEKARYLKSMMGFWTFGLGLNSFILFVLLFTFSLEVWAWYSSFFSYLLLGTLFLVTVIRGLHLEKPKNAEVNRFLHASKMIFGFSVYGAACLFFYLTIPLLFAACLFNRMRYQRICRWLCHKAFLACVDYARWCGVIDIQFHNVDSARNAKLIVCNHISMFDIVSILAHFPNCTTFVKRKFFRNPFLWPMIASCGYLPIDDADSSSRITATHRAMAVITNGGQVVVFPEGTRSKDGSLGAFQSGVFRMAVALGVPVTPVVFQSDAPFLNSKSSSHQARRTIHMTGTIMPPIAPDPNLDGRQGAMVFCEQVRSRFLDWTQAPVSTL